MAFGFKRTITIDHTKVGSADSTDFPVLVSGTYAYLATVANGGKVQNASGFDVGFYSDAGLTTKLKWETELYTAASGLVVYHVKVPSVSHTVDTVIYMAYGNAAITTDQSDAANTWNSGYNGVWHLGDGSTLGLADSTTNASTLTNVNTVTATTGKISGGGSFNGTSQRLTHADAAILRPTAALTISAWITPLVDFSTYRTIVQKSNGGTSFNYFLDLEVTSGKIRFLTTHGGGTFGNVVAPTGLSIGTTYYIAGTFDGSTVTLYQNGASIGTPSSSSGARDLTFDLLAIGCNTGAGGAVSFFDGMIDEVRLSNVARSADWITAEYNNQLTPSTFYTVGSEVPNSVSYTITAAQGSYALSGQVATLRSARTMAASRGSYTLTGEPLGFSLSHRSLVAAQGSYALSGQSVAFHIARRMQAAQGSYALTGEAFGAVVFVPPKHYRVTNATAPLYRLIDTSAPTYTASIAISPQYTITEIEQDV